MQFDLIYKNVAGRDLLAASSDEFSRDTLLARVTVRRSADRRFFRLSVARTGKSFPNAESQPNPIASNVANQIQMTEEWVAILENADIRLQGLAKELRCSVTIDDAALKGSDGTKIMEIAAIILRDAVGDGLSTSLPRAELMEGIPPPNMK